MTGRIAVITGASRGLGRSMAVHLSPRGVGVLGTFRSSPDEAAVLVDEIGAAGGQAAMAPLDLTDMASIDAFASRLPDLLETNFGRGKFDFLVNNGGASVAAPFAETSEAQFDAMMQVHVKGPYFLTQALLPMMTDGGAVVNVTSGFSRFTLPNSSAYGIAKSAMEAMTRFLALELGPRRIRVNSVVPGPIETDIGGGVVKTDEDVRDYLAGTIALGRVGRPDDIGRAVAALLSDDFGWANGARIELSGGQLL